MKHLFAVVFLLLANQVHAVGWQNSPKIAELFSKAGVQGTFVLYDVSANRLIGHDRVRAETRFIPASTFKIPNSLIGLSVGAVESVTEVLPYGGEPQPFDAWEKDMGLRDAIKISNVPVYQELARRIGLERMRNNVVMMGFGNQEIGTVVDNFWLVGPLKISALEQAQFLARLAQDTLPFSTRDQETVREIVRLEQGDNWTLHGKTGWVNAPNAGVGWWVGWVKKDNRVYAFALTIDIHQAADAAKRVELGMASLRALGVI